MEGPRLEESCCCDHVKASHEDQTHIKSLLFSLTALAQDEVQKFVGAPKPLESQKSFDGGYVQPGMLDVAAAVVKFNGCSSEKDQENGAKEDDRVKQESSQGGVRKHDVEKEKIIFKKDTEEEEKYQSTNTAEESPDTDTNQDSPQQPGRFFLKLMERMEELKERFDEVLVRSQSLEAAVGDLVQRESALEVVLDRQVQKITSVDERQVEQERVLLAPMRSIYIRQFHDQVREGISQKMPHSRVYLQHRRALQQRVQQHERAIQESLEPFFEADLWKFMEEAHVIAPKFFSKGVLWNKFIDAILEDSNQLAELGLSRGAVQLTRYWRGAEADNSQDAHLRNKLVFAEVVSAQSDERRPLYAELYEFFYKVPPETMYIKGEPDLPNQPIQAPHLKDEVVIT